MLAKLTKALSLLATGDADELDGRLYASLFPALLLSTITGAILVVTGAGLVVQLLVAALFIYAGYASLKVLRTVWGSGLGTLDGEEDDDAPMAPEPADYPTH